MILDAKMNAFLSLQNFKKCYHLKDFLIKIMCTKFLAVSVVYFIIVDLVMSP